MIFDDWFITVTSVIVYNYKDNELRFKKKYSKAIDIENLDLTLQIICWEKKNLKKGICARALLEMQKHDYIK